MDTRQVDFDVRRNSEGKEGLETLSALKLDAQRSQKKGLPFIMASVILWGDDSGDTVSARTSREIESLYLHMFLLSDATGISLLTIPWN